MYQALGTITAGAFREALMRAYAMQGGDEAAARFRRMYEMGPDKRWVETKEGALDAEQRFRISRNPRILTRALALALVRFVRF